VQKIASLAGLNADWPKAGLCAHCQHYLADIVCFLHVSPLSRSEWGSQERFDHLRGSGFQLATNRGTQRYLSKRDAPCSD
jgi:hypothetical protein